MLGVCDNLLHDLTLSHSDNPLLISIVGRLRDLIDWAHHIVAKLQPKGKVDALPEQLEILDVLIERDVLKMQCALRKRLQDTMRRTLAAWNQASG
jgi:DNA-binding GntR family transcriptional regulator